ncbi:MAG: aminotransferase class I/II-fold pyridoxal phosphate-dependent enzyme [Planctomycetota bacterium]
MHPLTHEATRRLAELTAAGTRRTIEPPRGIDFASNDTLGLRFDPRVLEAAATALHEYGIGAGAARLLRGDTPLHGELEEAMCAATGHEDALHFPSGFHANVGVLQTLGAEGWTIHSDAHNHASIIDGCRAAKAETVVYPHGELPDPAADRALIVTESVFSMGGDRPPIPARAAATIVDEAHAIGLFAPAPTATVSVIPCGKALAGAGAIVAGPRPVIELLRSACRTFLFTTAAPPPVVAGVLAAWRIAQAEPERAARAVELARRIDPDAQSPIVMIPCDDAEHAMRRQRTLQQQGLDVRAVRPPTVATPALRLSLHADRTDDEVARLQEALAC